MTRTLLISCSGPDRVGVVAALTGRLFDLGLNLGDTSFAVLGTAFEFNAIAETSTDIQNAVVAAALETLDELQGCTLDVSEFRYDTRHTETARRTHRIRVSGGDQPGLIARLTEAFVEFDANIVRLNSQHHVAGGRQIYTTHFDVALNPDRAEACLAAVSNTAQQLQLECSWEDI